MRVNFRSFARQHNRHNQIGLTRRRRSRYLSTTQSNVIGLTRVLVLVIVFDLKKNSNLLLLLFIKN